MSSSSSILAKDNGETLAEHTIRCLKVSDILLDNLPFNKENIERLRKDLHLALATHDVGKAAIGFQRSLQKGAPLWGHRHEILSAAFASTLGLSEEIILAIITHHKSLPSDGITQIKGCLHSEDIPWETDTAPKWSELVKEWDGNLPMFAEQWSRICTELKREDLRAFNKLTALSINKSWLRRRKQNKNIPFEDRYYASLLRGLLISSDHIASNDSINPSFMPPNIRALKEYKHDSLTNMLQKQLHGFQKKSSEHIGNLILRAPTGSGKTLAALLWAQLNQNKNGRLFYALPTLASINSMYLRLCEYFGGNNSNDGVVGLLHSRVASLIYSMRETDADLSSKLTSQRIAKTMNSLAREMWFPIRVCTPHQILRYTLQGKGWDTMLSEFPNSCFIFDEIHAYDPTVTGLTVATAKFLINQNASCLFLSATMPAFLKNILETELQSITFLEPNPIDESDRQILDLKRHSLQIVDGDMLSNIQMMVKKIEKAKSTLIVCNHVPSAQLIYDEIKKRFNSHDDNILLLHSRFCRSDRNKIEQQLGKSLPRVLVSTQVVEVSLDLDFEQGFFEPAPIDALIQRLGRVNRFGKQSSSGAKVVILTNQLHSFNIYDPKIVEESLKELQTLANPIGERELVDAADRVYSNGYSDKNQSLYEQALNHPRIRKFQENLIAGIYNDWIDDVIDKSDSTEDMLPASLLTEYEQYDALGLKIKANNLLVPVPIRILHFMKDSIDMNSDPWIIKVPYSKEKGLDL